MGRQKTFSNQPKIPTKRKNLNVFSRKDALGIANSGEPDQTAPLGAVRSGSAQFAQTYLSENLGSLWKPKNGIIRFTSPKPAIYPANKC